MRTRRGFLKIAGMAAAATSFPEVISAADSSHSSAASDQSGISGSHSLRAHAQAREFLVGLHRHSAKIRLRATLERDVAIAKTYRDYPTMMLAEPNVTALLTWGITDRYTWLGGPKWARSDGQPQRSLPLDADYKPTPAFFALRDSIDKRRAKV
jgi:hypothetical protein